MTDFVLLLFLLFSCHLLSVAYLCVTSNTYESIQSFFDALNGTQWKWKNISHAWNFSSEEDPCLMQWEGITCNARCNLTSLTLQRHNLVGQLPSSLSSLIELQKLDLSLNRLSNSVPEVFGGMYNMTYNKLNGAPL